MNIRTLLVGATFLLLETLALAQVVAGGRRDQLVVIENDLETCLEQNFERNKTLDKKAYEGCKARQGLTLEQVEGVIASNLGQFRKCYETELVNNPGLSGLILTSFVVRKNGNVDRIKIEQNQTESEVLGLCMISAMKAWQFAEPAHGKDVRIQYPFHFQKNSRVYAGKGSGTFTLGMGRFNISGDYEPREISATIGLAVELGTAAGRHNLLMVLQGAESKQGDGDRHRFPSDGRHVGLGYMGFLYRGCGLPDLSVRVCAGVGWGFFEMTQYSNQPEDIGMDDRVLGTVPVQLAITKTWYANDRLGDGGLYGQHLVLTVDYLNPHGIEIISVLLSYGFRFSSADL